jgi:dTDP-4-amino-4,6-dideoxygalactose transaminase
MYVETKGIQILSFQIKKILPIGRGGMILTDDFEAYSWFLKARHDGRDLSSPYDSPDHIGEIGWHFYMTPEDAARGLKIFSDLPAENADCMNYTMYPDLQQWKIWQ